MSIKTKLLLSYFGFSFLIILVGLLFYTQLVGLIEPLTPKSIPKSIELLSHKILVKNSVYEILQKNIEIEYDFENYLVNKELSAYQDYFMHHIEMLSLLQHFKQIDVSATEKLTKNYNQLSTIRQGIIQAIRMGQLFPIQKTLIEGNYYNKLTDYLTELHLLFFSNKGISDELAIVTLKQTSLNTTHILKQSLNSTLVLFAAAVFISILLIFLISNNVFKPIKALRDNILRVSSGELDAPIDSEKFRDLSGEVGELTRDYLKLIEKLQSTTVSRDHLFKEVQRRKAYENNLQKTTERLMQSNKDLDEFAYAASHDLRAPLQAIQSLVHWIEMDCEDILPPKSKKHFERLKARIIRLDNLITGILTYSRVGKLEKKKEVVDLNKLIKEIIDTLSPLEIKIVLPDHLPLIFADKTEISQVFQNLIDNAIKYNDKGNEGLIEIGCKKVERFYQFYVADNGPGIDPKYHEKIFMLFQTLQSKDKVESSGIGLSIVKKIIEKERGKIWVESKKGRGATFYFLWPRNED